MSTSKPTGQDQTNPRQILAVQFTLMVIAVVLGGAFVPGGGVVLALAFFFVVLRGHRAAFAWLLGIGIFMLLANLLTLLGNAIPVISHHS